MLPAEAKNLDLYAVLEVHPEADTEDIREAGEKILNSSGTAEKKQQAVLAMNVLTDKEQRSEYDQLLISRVKPLDPDQVEKIRPFDIFRNLILFFSGRVPFLNRLWLVLSLIYLIWPLDVIPDLIPGLGQTDDILLVALSYYLSYLKLKNKNR